MSKNLERVIQRAISDAAFRRQLQSNPEAALRGFKLTDSEVAALRSGDAGKLTSLGIDQRMSKTFTFGGDSLASRASIGGDLTSGAGTAALDGGATSGATRLVIDSAGGNTAAFDPGIVGDTVSVSDPTLESSGTSVIADPDNPGFARGYIGGGQAAPTSDALEDQSHTFSASRSADVGGSSTVGYGANYPEHGGLAGQSADVGGSTVGYGVNYPEHGGLAGQSADMGTSARGSIIGDPDNPANARGYIGDPGASAATSSNIGDPDNPASARTFTGGQTASTSDAIEDQSHAFAASRDQGTSGATASSISDPDNPGYARGYTGGEVAPTSDALEDQSHAIAASRSDAFLSEGEVSQYSAGDTNLSTGQADDAGQLFNSNASDITPDDTTATQHHEPDVPS